VRVFFRNYNSFDWFCKNNRTTLIDAGALVRIGRDYFVDIEKLPTQIVAIRGICVQEAA
jgi:hypothetical protein